MRRDRVGENANNVSLIGRREGAWWGFAQELAPFGVTEELFVVIHDVLESFRCSIDLLIGRGPCRAKRF